MKRIFKWLSIISGIFIVLIVAAIIILPKIIDVKKYKPLIEQKVVGATGRSFTLGDEIDLSVFPWVGIKVTDVHFGNPSGYSGKDMVSVKNFEVRLKVLPLLSKKIEVKTFVMDEPTINLEKLKNGKANWQDIGNKTQKKEVAESKPEKTSSDQSLAIEELKVESFSINKGQLIFIDQGTGVRKEISDLNLKLVNISLENPVGILFDAIVDGNQLSLEGTAGPIGKEPGKGTIAIDFVLKALNELEVKLNGSLVDPMTSQKFDLNVNVASFSPRKIMASLNQEFPVQTKDPDVLKLVSFKTHIKGNKDNVFLSNGEIILDDSKMLFSATAKEFSKPNMKINLKLDTIDLDRYLPEPPVKEETSEAESKPVKPAESSKKKTDYGPLRKLVLDGKINAGKVKAHGAIVENIKIHILAKKGIITIDPLSLDLYKGSVASKINLNVQKNNPVTKMVLKANGIQAGPLLKDSMQMELIEGTVKSNITLAMIGETPEMIKKTLTGKGELLFTDGAIIGIDLAGLVRNAKATLGLSEKPKEKPRTDFAELKIPFTSKKGLVNTIGANMISPFLRIIVKGDADLVKELLDLRVDPKFVATLKGQGDTKERSGLMVPVNITGTFDSPKIRPDLKGIVSGDLPDTKEVIEQVLGTKEEQKETVESFKEDPIKELENFLSD
ncbi:MAG: AsmA family protein [Desulfobacteraceae bacterium]|nr:AsmA family protein [Desulfobacteraceae bacterium]